MDRQPTQSGANPGAGVPMTLAALQNVLKRDPEAYREEFLQQWRHSESNLDIFRLQPADSSQAFQELVSFVAAVAPCYPDVVEVRQERPACALVVPPAACSPTLLPVGRRSRSS